MERVLHGHQPYPAVIVDRHSNLVSANKAFGTIIANLDEWAWHVIDALDRETTRNPDTHLDDLIGELTTWSPADRNTSDRITSASPSHYGSVTTKPNSNF